MEKNILIIYSDQHSARTLGCYGNTEVITPNLDKLASDGVVMDNAFCNNPICTPSRMCLLSGQYVHNFGYYGLAGKKPENLPNMFGYLKRFGYKTGAIGKIHTPAGWVSEHCDFLADGYGFEVPITSENIHMEEGCQGYKDDDYAQYLKELGLYEDRDDKVINEWYEKYGHSRDQCLDARPSRLPAEHSFEAWCAKKAIEFIEKSNENKDSFFLWLTMPRPHETYVPAKKFWDMYENVDFNLPANSENTMAGRSENARLTQERFQKNPDWIEFEPNDFESARRRVLRGYYACVTQLDDAIGQVLSRLDELNLTKDTIVVYMTDHGEFAGEHGMIEKAPGIGFSCVTKIPMIWKYDGCEAGGRRNSIVESVDVLPTLCNLANLPHPDWVDGVSIKPVLDSDTSVKEYAVTEFPYTKTIHTKKFKLTQYLPEFHNGQDFGELFDREKDPWELNNLYFDERYKDIVNSLRFELYCWLLRSTRAVTVNPRIPVFNTSPCQEKLTSNDVASGYSWDMADELGISCEDGKIGSEFYRKLVSEGYKNYM